MLLHKHHIAYIFLDVTLHHFFTSTFISILAIYVFQVLVVLSEQDFNKQASYYMSSDREL